MALKIDITVEGLKASTKKFKSLIDENNEIVQTQFGKSAFNIVKNARKRVPVDTGRLRSSIQAQIRKRGLEVLVFSDLKYSVFVEYGTKPHFPPPNALAGWARRHGMPGMEFVIARNIARRGTKPQPFMKPAWDQEKLNTLARVKRAVRKLGR
jgi:HK97 gp10 family phage protein